uniref:Polysaccharide pyruvyl transferase family protein n=1 Tax=Desertifilum tharense IPPAS B-1220 TaxID=1781255 RepID=A0ACD5GYL6_9CYAN
MGDLWPIFQDFREKIATQYPNRRIIILPQTIYFKNPENLKKAAKAFNSHPDLTLFVRDDTSYAIAQENFHKCRILKAPDMAFHLVGMPDLNFQLPYKKTFCITVEAITSRFLFQR